MTAGKKRRSGLTLILLALILIMVLIAAGVLLLGGGGLSFGGTEPKTLPTPTKAQEMVEIVILAQPIPRGATISDDVLSKILYPKKEMVEGLFFTKVEDVVGKKAKYDLSAGLPLTPNLVTINTTGSPLSFQIPKGLVAVSVPINRLTAVSYTLLPGDHVNIIGSMLFIDLDTEFQTKLPNWTSSVSAPSSGVLQQCGGQCYPAGQGLSIDVRTTGISAIQGRSEVDPRLEGQIGAGLLQYLVPSEYVKDKNNDSITHVQRPRLVSQTMVQDAIVLWVGEYSKTEVEKRAMPLNAPTPTPTAVPETPKAKEGEAQALQKPEVITLVVTPQDAVTLNYLMIVGSNLNLVLRSAGDDERIATEAVTLQFMLEQYNIPYPNKLPYGTEPRVDDFSNVQEKPKGVATPAK